MKSKPVKHVYEMRCETYANRHVANGVLKDQVPADDPRNQLAHGCVGVGVGAARNRNHGREFRVTQSCKPADNGHQDERQSEGWPCPRPPYSCRVMNQEVEQWSVKDGGRIELLAGNGGTDYSEDTGSDHCPDA